VRAGLTRGFGREAPHGVCLRGFNGGFVDTAGFCLAVPVVVGAASAIVRVRD
jgi:hypothetical protein